MIIWTDSTSIECHLVDLQLVLVAAARSFSILIYIYSVVTSAVAGCSVWSKGTVGCEKLSVQGGFISWLIIETQCCSTVYSIGSDDDSRVTSSIRHASSFRLCQWTGLHGTLCLLCAVHDERWLKVIFYMAYIFFINLPPKLQQCRRLSMIAQLC